MTYTSFTPTMRKLLFVFITVLIASIDCDAQGYEDFKLMPDATFKTVSGKDYQIVAFQDKTAHDIYQIMTSNINHLYNNPSMVVTSVDDSSIKIRALGQFFYFKVLGKKIFYDGYYQLIFSIKEGRVKVNSPFFEKDLRDGTIYSHDVKNVAKKLFKNGIVKDKAKEEYDYVNTEINNLIKEILGLSEKQKKEDDW